MSRHNDRLQATARRLMFEIRAQVSPKGYAIPSTCIECKGAAVNGACCATCLTKGLSYIVGTQCANAYLESCQNQRAAEDAVMQLVGK